MSLAARHAGRVSEDGSLLLRDRPAWLRAITRQKGREVWLEIHRQSDARSLDSNAYLWGVIYDTIAEETGNEPAAVHYALKREAVRLGVLAPHYINLGDRRVETEPTTCVDQEAFNRYLQWVKVYAATELRIVLPADNEVAP